MLYSVHWITWAYSLLISGDNIKFYLIIIIIINKFFEKMIMSNNIYYHLSF